MPSGGAGLRVWQTAWRIRPCRGVSETPQSGLGAQLPNCVRRFAPVRCARGEGASPGKWGSSRRPHGSLRNVPSQHRDLAQDGPSPAVSAQAPRCVGRGPGGHGWKPRSPALQGDSLLAELGGKP